MTTPEIGPLVMAPLLRQAIQLLQLSPLELQEVRQRELLGNPLLEAAAPRSTSRQAIPDAAGRTGIGSVVSRVVATASTG
jgi:DNA-directed RNA polymerase specialized sigma54-like protein